MSLPTQNSAGDKLALYYYDGCPYCSMVRSSIEALDLDVELRNTSKVTQYRQDLAQARGRATVPVLRIVSPLGEERWMPESRDIANYLHKNYG